MKLFYKTLGPLVLAGLALAGCKKELDTFYTPQDAAGGYETLGTFNFVFNSKYSPGEQVFILSAYNANDNPTSITVFQATKTDSAQVGTYPINGKFEPSPGLTAQQVPYVVPSNYAIGTPIRVDIILNFQNGGKRIKSFRYQVANAPTLAFGSPQLTYRNGLGAAAQREGDMLGYTLVLNAGGIATSTTPTPKLFKNVDSLVYYARTATNSNLTRQGVVKNPTAGTENKRPVDVRIPVGAAAAGGAQFVFIAYAQFTRTTLVTDLVPATTAATALGTTRRGAVSFGGGSSADSVAFNLSAGRNEPAANPVDAKDLQATSISTSGALGLSAPNTTRYYKLTPTQLAALPYATATANDVALVAYQNTATADLGTPAVGDVYAVRLRGTGTPMLLRIVGTKASTSGGVGRVKFEYRSL